MSRWDREYRQLPQETRSAVNELVNAIFRHQTGFPGKIDPQAQPQLAAQWIAIRDKVLDNRQKFAQWLSQTATNVAAAIPIFSALDTTPAWIRIARRQLGTHELPGKQHNPKIMEYIWTCTNIQQTEAQRKYVTREGEEGVDWCSAFVNWCLQQTGIIGTNHALASSWKDWGTKLDGPKQGAIVCFSWKGTRIDHVAFCDEVNGKFEMLGGNQTGHGGTVSSVYFNKNAARHYRWPAGA
jgi:uncharacterized protein (TIGR02594 family)